MGARKGGWYIDHGGDSSGLVYLFISVSFVGPLSVVWPALNNDFSTFHGASTSFVSKLSSLESRDAPGKVSCLHGTWVDMYILRNGIFEGVVRT